MYCGILLIAPVQMVIAAMILKDAWLLLGRKVMYLLLPGELAKHAMSEGTKAVTKYTSSK